MSDDDGDDIVGLVSGDDGSRGVDAPHWVALAASLRHIDATLLALVTLRRPVTAEELCRALAPIRAQLEALSGHHYGVPTIELFLRTLASTRRAAVAADRPGAYSATEAGLDALAERLGRPRGEPGRAELTAIVVDADASLLAWPQFAEAVEEWKKLCAKEAPPLAATSPAWEARSCLELVAVAIASLAEYSGSAEGRLGAAGDAPTLPSAAGTGEAMRRAGWRTGAAPPSQSGLCSVYYPPPPVPSPDKTSINPVHFGTP